ncbi:MAG: hypothetical protein M3R65_10030 [Gemmatimonadota bacterium]|nr:hypothetical protein [Gemmatimonadota bacterium]
MRIALRSSAGMLAVLLLSGAACSGSLMTDPATRVDVSIARNAYTSGDTVIAVVRNLGAVTLTYPYGFCKTALQREQGGIWSTVLLPPDGCPLALGILAPGASVPLQYVLPSNVPGGLYRLTMPAPVPKDAAAPEPDLATPPFTVNSVILGAPL